MSIDPDIRRAIADEVAARLKRVCAHWPEDVFHEMVDRIAEITIRYDRRAGESSMPYDRRASDELLAAMKQALARSRSLGNKTGGTGSGTEEPS